MKFRMKMTLILFCMLVFASATYAGWNPFRRSHRRSGEENVQRFIKELKENDPAIIRIFNNAVGWAVFPEITKAGIGVGGAAGNGRVYQNGKFIGTTTMTQVSIGFQLGGQVYSEIVFFQDINTINKFKTGKLELGGNISAVVANTGAAAEAGFKDGTIVVVKPKGGLMYEATISGQKFTFKGHK